MKTFLVLLLLIYSFTNTLFAQGNDPDEEPSLQTENSAMKKSEQEITKLKADAKKKRTENVSVAKTDKVKSSSEKIKKGKKSKEKKKNKS